MNCSYMATPFPRQSTQMPKPPPPLYRSYFVNHVRVDRQNTCFTPSSSSSIGISRRFPRVFSKQHGGSLNENYLFPLETKFSLFYQITQGSLPFLCFITNFLILRDPKNALGGVKSEIFSFLKTRVSLAAAFGLIFFCKTLPFFNPFIVPIIAFSGPVEFFLYPLINYYIRPQSSAANLLGLKIPMSNKISLLSNVGPEWWMSSATSLLAWGYANQITKAEEAKRFYPLFGITMNCSLIFFGRTVKTCSILKYNFGSGADNSAIICWGMMTIVALMALVICIWWVNAQVPPPTSDKKEATTKKRAHARTNRKKNEGPKSPRKRKSRNQIKDVSKPQQRKRIHVRTRTDIHLDN